MKNNTTAVYIGEELSHYHFGDQHPFGSSRYPAFLTSFKQQNLDKETTIKKPVLADTPILELFHTQNYIEKVIEYSRSGDGYLDAGDTPAVQGIYEAACYVVGSTVDAVDHIMQEEFKTAFVPIAGLHHARRNCASGFCVFNDIGVAIEILKSRYKLERIAYIDIDAHHGDGVYYEFEDDPSIIFADIHQDGNTLYPGTGFEYENGKGKAQGLKLNLPLQPYATDKDFNQIWPTIESFLYQHQPQFIILQGGADSIEGDPITQMHFSYNAHAHAAARLKVIAEAICQGRLLALGGGGYNLTNIAQAWTHIVKSLTCGLKN